MSARIVFENRAAYERVAEVVETTAAIEGGVGAVRIGRPAPSGDGQVVIAHPFAEVDLDWIEAYAADPGMSIVREES